MIRTVIKGAEIAIQGHSESRVCTAVSVLSQTLIKVCLSKGIKISYDVPAPGETTGITYIYFPKGVNEASPYLDFFFTGLMELAEVYPTLLEVIVEQ